MKLNVFLLIISVILSSNIYASATCYSVGLIDVRKQNADGLRERFHIPNQCIIANIGRFASVRCGCFNTSKEAQEQKNTVYQNYSDAYVVKTKRERFSKQQQPQKHHQIKKTQPTDQKTSHSQNNEHFALVKIDPITKKLIPVTEEEVKHQKTEKKPKFQAKKRKETKPYKIKRSQPTHTTTQHIVHRKTTTMQPKVIAKPVPQKLIQKAHTAPVHHKTQKQMTPINDEKIMQKLQALKPHLKGQTSNEKQHTIHKHKEEPKHIAPKKEKKYFHEQDEDIADILEFIDSEEDLGVENTKDDESFFYDNFDEENDLYLDD